MENTQSPMRPSNWNPHRRGLVPQYKYKTVKEIYSSNDSKEFHNVFGVVVDSRPVEKSKGSDFYCLVRIVDPTFCQGEGVKVTLFHQDDKFLPSVDQWDIIRLHRVRAKIYQGALSLVSSKGWSWVSWKGKVTENEEDVGENGKSGSTTTTIVAEDSARVNSLRTWISKQGYFSLDMAQNASDNGVDRSLSELKPGCFFNLVCQVTGMATINKKLTVLKVWDGTLPAYKIEPGPYSLDQLNTLAHVEDIENYIVDVSVFDNHVLTVEESIELGSFVRFCNLHASPKNLQFTDSPSAADSGVELFLHGGMVFNRGVVTLDTDTDTVATMKSEMLGILDSFGEKSVEKSPGKRKSTDVRQHTPIKKKKTKSILKEEKSPCSVGNDEFSTPIAMPNGSILNDGHDSDACTSNLTAQSQDTLALLTSLNSNKKDHTQGAITRRDVGVQVDQQMSQTETFGSLSVPHESESQGLAVDENVPESNPDSCDLRCHQKSVTTVFGDDSPLLITSISNLLSASISPRSSRFFRIRAKVFRCSDPNNIVFHFCPVTGLRLPASNDGSKIELSDEAFKHICSWRTLSDLAKQADGDSTQPVDSSNFTETQWPSMEGSEGDHISVNMETYNCLKDDSKWETLKFKNNFTRKRKKNRSRFNILYREDKSGNVNLKTAGKNFNRVVRVCSKELLQSQQLPSVVYQDGIFYYCSPACIDRVSIPSLVEEAQSFDIEKPRLALCCPVLPIQFHLKLLLEDQSDAMEAILKGHHAVAFFNDVTPEQYLRDTNDCRKLIADDIARLLPDETTSEETWAEMVIEKKSRRPLSGNSDPIILYEIVNTRIVV